MFLKKRPQKAALKDGPGIFVSLSLKWPACVGGATEAWLTQKLAPQPAPQAPARVSSYLPQELLQAQQRVEANVAAMVHAIANHQFERARALSNQEREAREKFRILREKYSDEYGMPC